MTGSSAEIKGSILEALQEEKQSPLKRMQRTLSMLAAISIPVIGVLWFSFQQDFNFFWLVSLLVWLSIAAGASFFYWKPQPRLVVRGFWTRWMYSKVLLLFLAISALQLLICPHLAMISPSPYFSLGLFEPLQNIFMAWGGMGACMFFCGMSFSTIASLIALFLMRRATEGSPYPVILKIAGLALLAQIPIVILQVSDPHLRGHFSLWLLGGFIGALSVTCLLSLIFKKLSLYLRS